MRNVRAALLPWVPAGYAVLLFAAVFIPQVAEIERAGGGAALGFDKVLHFLGFFGFGFLLIISLGLRPNRNPGLALLLALGVSVAYGVSHEAAQWFMWNRVVNPWDAVFNVLGAVTGILLSSLVVEWWLRSDRLEILAR